MKIFLELEVENGKEEKIIYDFMNAMVKDLRNLLYGHRDEIEYLKIEKAILNSKLILWRSKQKPKEIDAEQVVIDIIKAIKWYRHKDNKFIIQIDRSKKFMNTNTQLTTIANFIEYGNPYSLPLHFFSRYFNEFANKARVYWSSYKQLRTQIKVKEIVTVI